MNTPMPISKATSLYNEFISLVKSDNVIDELMRQKYKVAAKEEIKHDALMAYMLLGVIAAEEFNTNDMHRFHMNAININDSEVTRDAYASSLGYVGDTKGAAIQQHEAAKKSPEDLSLLDLAVTRYTLAGMLSEALEVAGDLKQRRKNFDLGILNRSITVLQNRGITEEDYQASIQNANEVLFENRIKGKSSRVSADITQGEETIFYTLQINVDLEKAMELQREMVEKVSDALGDRWRPDAIMFEYQPKI